jgi:hypothetical protein
MTTNNQLADDCLCVSFVEEECKDTCTYSTKERVCQVWMESTIHLIGFCTDGMTTISNRVKNQEKMKTIYT